MGMGALAKGSGSAIKYRTRMQAHYDDIDADIIYDGGGSSSNADAAEMGYTISIDGNVMG